MIINFYQRIKSSIVYCVLLAATMIFIVSCGEDDVEPTGDEIKSTSDDIIFSNYRWTSKETKNIADSRYFCLTSKENVKLNDDGSIKLQLVKKGDTWYGGEITLDSALGFGEYSFEIKVESGQFDANAAFEFTVLNIIDNLYEGMTQTGIRFNKYSDKSAPNEMEYFLYATDKKFAEVQTPDTPFLLTGLYSSHKIGIFPNYLFYSSKGGGGFYNEFKALKKSEAVPDIPDAITFSESTDNLKVIMSLCLPESNETSDGQKVEVTVRNFKYTPHISDYTHF